MSNLHPEQIVDRNGVVTTRHKKDASAPSPGKQRIKDTSAPKVADNIQPVNIAGAELIAGIYTHGARFIGNGFNEKTVDFATGKFEGSEYPRGTGKGSWTYRSIDGALNQQAVEKLVGAGLVEVRETSWSAELIVTDAGVSSVLTSIPNLKFEDGTEVGSWDNLIKNAATNRFNNPEHHGDTTYEHGDNIFD